MTPEQRLISEIMMRNIRSAIWPFRIPDEKIPSLENQYNRFLKRKSPVLFLGPQMAETTRAKNTLEWDLHLYIEDLDLGDRFYTKAFDFVQKCILLRNKLLREQRANGKDKYFIQRQTKIKEL